MSGQVPSPPVTEVRVTPRTWRTDASLHLAWTGLSSHGEGYDYEYDSGRSDAVAGRSPVPWLDVEVATGATYVVRIRTRVLDASGEQVILSDWTSVSVTVPPPMSVRGFFAGEPVAGGVGAFLRAQGRDASSLRGVLGVPGSP